MAHVARARVVRLGTVGALLALIVHGAPRPGWALVRPPIARGVDCPPSYAVEMGLSASPSVAVVRVPITVTSTPPTLVTSYRSASADAHCPGGVVRTTLAQGWTWRLDVPPGSHAQLANTATLAATFTPDVPGSYTVHFNGCGTHCFTTAPEFVNGKPVFVNGRAVRDTIGYANAERQLSVAVTLVAQVPPQVVPLARPSPAGAAPTSPQLFAAATPFCGSRTAIGLELEPEWYTTAVWGDGELPTLELAEGRVYDSFVSRIDSPGGHHDNDADVKIEVDPWLRRLLTVGTADDIGAVGLPVGGLEVEWEWSQWAEGFRPMAGDRISALGYHVIDCGHSINSEIHPPIAVAVQRPLPVLLPTTTSLERGQPAVPIGTNLYVPGVITDVFVNLNGGDILACRDNSLHQSRRISRNNPVGITTPCVARPDRAGVPFTFHVYLPVNPQRLVRSLTGGTPPVPALYTAVVDAPEAPPGLDVTSLPLRIVDTTHLDSDVPYLTVSVDLSHMRTGERYAKRLIAAWVYPDLAGTNYGLRALRVGLDSLVVTDDGDGNTPFNGGDWRFWIGYANAVRPWTRVIACDGCVKRQTYPPSSSVFRTGGLARDGVFAGEMLQFALFPAASTRLRMTGYDNDTFGSDDVGEVDTYIGRAGHDVEYSVCNNNTVGTTGLNPSNSGCAGYTAYLNVTPGHTAVASTLSAQTRAFLTRLLVGEPLLRTLPPIADPELYTPRLALGARGSEPRVSPRVLPLTSHREGEGERWQATFAPSQLPGVTDAFVAGLRRRVLDVLGANPTAAMRAKVGADLARVKAAIPPALYQKHLCDLETGRACASPP